MTLFPIRSLAAILAVTVGVLPIAQTNAQAMLAPASTVQNAPVFDRDQDINVIQAALESKILREKLQGLGLSDDEIQSRLSRMSDAEVHQLASQIRSVHPAGSLLIGLLVVVVLVLLIIYLFKRI